MKFTAKRSTGECCDRGRSSKLKAFCGRSQEEPFLPPPLSPAAVKTVSAEFRYVVHNHVSPAADTLKRVRVGSHTISTTAYMYNAIDREHNNVCWKSFPESASFLNKLKGLCRKVALNIACLAAGRWRLQRMMVAKREWVSFYSCRHAAWCTCVPNIKMFNSTHDDEWKWWYWGKVEEVAKR